MTVPKRNSALALRRYPWQFWAGLALILATGAAVTAGWLR
jgi:hypothetical protein